MLNRRTIGKVCRRFDHFLSYYWTIGKLIKRPGHCMSLIIGIGWTKSNSTERKAPMSTQTKPSIVFVHGIWADGSSFSKVIPPLRAEGYEVMTSQHGLDTHQSDVDCVIRTLGRVSSPAILVGHSYGGSLITAAGTDDRVAGLVYIAALAPDENETSQSQQNQFPRTDVFSYIEVADGRVWLRPDGIGCFAG